MKSSEKAYRRAEYSKRVQKGGKMMVVWVDVKAWETLKAMAESDRRSMSNFVAITLEKIAKNHAENQTAS